jgi:hypothetical protein
MAKHFGARKFEDFQIKENHKVVGTLRIKPSGILWASRCSHRWYRIGISEFAQHAVSHRNSFEASPHTGRSAANLIHHLAKATIVEMVDWA